VGKGANPVAHKPINYLTPFVLSAPRGCKTPVGYSEHYSEHFVIPLPPVFRDLSVNG
jgi:hypothetical protein